MYFLDPKLSYIHQNLPINLQYISKSISFSFIFITVVIYNKFCLPIIAITSIIIITRNENFYNIFFISYSQIYLL